MPVYLVIAILIVLIGLLIVIFQLYFLNKALKSRKWEVSKGVIISSTLKTLNFTNESNSTYKAVISYKYSILGKTYISNRIFFGDKIQTNFKVNVLDIISKYPVGRKVDVFYNPSNVKESVLEKGKTYNVLILLLIGLSAILFGFILMKYYPLIVLD